MEQYQDPINLDDPRPRINFILVVTAIIFGLIGVGVGYVIFGVREAANNIENNAINLVAQETGDNDQFIQIDKCSNKECLFKKVTGDESNSPGFNIEGLAILRGYYSLADNSCHTFVVMDGNQELINGWVEAITEGNGINSLDSEGRVVLGLRSNLSPDLIQSMQSSSLQSPVNIAVVRTTPAGMGAPGCGLSFVEVIAVE